MGHTDERNDRCQPPLRPIADLSGDYARDDWQRDLGGDHARDEYRDGLGGDYARDIRWGRTGAWGDYFGARNATAHGGKTPRAESVLDPL